MLTLRLTKTEEQALNQVVRIGRYRSRADAVRTALIALFKSHGLKEEGLDQIKQERRKAAPRKSNLIERLQ